MTHRRHKQIEIAVAINVRECGSAGKLRRTARASGGGCVLEFPIAKVPIHHVAAVEPAEINVAVPIVVVIAHGHTGTVEQVFIGDEDKRGEGIGEFHPRLRRIHQREARLTGARPGKGSPAVLPGCLPV